MPTIKDHIYLGDTFAFAYDCYEPPASGASQMAQYPTKVPKPPDSAYVELFDIQNQALIEFSPGVTQATASIVDASVVYIVGASNFPAAGDFRLLVTITFPDSQIVTESRTIKVKPRT